MLTLCGIAGLVVLCEVLEEEVLNPRHPVVVLILNPRHYDIETDEVI